MADESFAGHPRSLGEARADKLEDGDAWKPRDALIQLLRAIDAKEIDVELLILCYGHRMPNGKKTVGFRAASAGDGLQIIGLLELVKAKYMEP